MRALSPAHGAREDVEPVVGPSVWSRAPGAQVRSRAPGARGRACAPPGRRTGRSPR